MLVRRSSLAIRSSSKAASTGSLGLALLALGIRLGRRRSGALLAALGHLRGARDDVGLALLAYMIWSKRMFSKSHSCSPRRSHRHAMMASSGNTAFDAYKADTLRRLEEEQNNFESFLERLRDAKDKAEFDQFMDDRANNGTEPSDDAADEPA